MPELPEVETVMRGLEPAMVGKKFDDVDLRRPNLRFPFPERFVERLAGHQVLSMARRAKYILVSLSSGEVLVMHLGMSGRFVIDPGDQEDRPGAFYHQPGVNPVHTHVIFSMSDGGTVHYNDARRFGFMVLVDEQGLTSHKFFHALGVEPLEQALSSEFLAGKALNKSVSLKSFLMDQRIIAGLGNIYVCEALYRAGLSPLSKASVLSTKAGKPTAKNLRLVPAIKAVLEEAIAAGGSSLRDHRQADGSLGYFQHSFSVYGRQGEPCRTADCKGKIRRVSQNGRSSFYCAHCQR